MKTNSRGHHSKHNFHKPFRIHHLGILVIAAWLFFGGSILGARRYLIKPEPYKVLGSNSIKVPADSLRSVELAPGIGLNINERVMETKVKAGDSYENSRNIKISGLKTAQDVYKRLELRLSPEFGLAPDLSSRLVMEVSSKAGNINNQSGTLIDSGNQEIGGRFISKNTYEITTNFAGSEHKSYSVVWLDEIANTEVRISLDGLQNPNRWPIEFDNAVDSISLPTQFGVLGANSNIVSTPESENLPANFTVDAVSPAVVKLYQITCGILAVDGRELGGNNCNASVGTGFFISPNGYIATSGHVVEYSAQDALVRALLENTELLVSYLRYIGLSDQEVFEAGQKPEILASLIANIYDAPPGEIEFKDQSSVLIVALGSKPLDLNDESQIRAALDHKDDDNHKIAEVIDTDYRSKDVFIVAAGREEGFSASDVAIAKVKIEDAPFIEMFDGQVTQNQPITIIGFPGDADNQLTDNNTITPTVTNGNISAIRIAAGSSYRLYQSDADASRGNSGGPVIDQNGRALGLLTYRFKSEEDIDAAKSYIRDINDVARLVTSNKLDLGLSRGSIQPTWVQALKLYSDSRFSLALSKFRDVKNEYPAHRLASSYISTSEQAIKDGKDIKDLPLALIIAASLTGAAGVAGSILLVSRHHARHRNFVSNHRSHLFVYSHAKQSHHAT